MLKVIRRFLRKVWRWAYYRSLLGSLLGTLDGILVRWGSRSRLGAHLYYALFSTSFAREQRAVLYGRRRYSQDLEEGQLDFLLRRNIHRIEKGLSMRPRRSLFAVDYILETVQALKKELDRRACSHPSEHDDLIWAVDVLDHYFGVVESHPRVHESLELFGQIPQRADDLDSLKIPRAHGPPESALSYEDYLKLTQQRRSVRWFSDKTVSRNVIDKAIVAAREAPTACNRQPFEFRVYDDSGWVERVSRLPGGARGYAHNIPVLVVIVGRLRAYFSDRDRHLVYIDGSLAAMSFMHALTTLGLATCPINWPDVAFREDRMQECLSLDPDERPIMLIAVGYPDEEGFVAHSEKRPLDEVRSFND